MMEPEYHSNLIEQRAQQTWRDAKCFKVSEDLGREKFYCLTMFPYPSGHLHMGHVRVFTISDVIARYQRMLGKNVLQPMGWDAFGLPAENAAIANKVAPADWTYKNIANMRAQTMRLGYAYDWSREITTCKPDYYRWEQWLFLKMYAQGLVYRHNSVVNWDPIDQTVLANEQVVNGRGWRSGALVERKEIPQWFLKITAYADELVDKLDELEGWPEQVKTMQRNWIGRSAGANIRFHVSGESPIEVFTTRLDTIFGVSYLAVAAEHPLAIKAASKNPDLQAFLNRCRNIQVAEHAMATVEKEGIFSGFYAIHPFSGENIPIWVANYVLMNYGTGAVMAVPAHDERDYEFAKQYQLPCHIVVTPSDGSPCDVTQKAFVEPGKLIHSGEFDGMTSEAAVDGMIRSLEQRKQGERQVQYRLRDWGVSRQRYWGAPIPIIYCQDCGTVPVPEADLPVVLPENIPIGKGTDVLKNHKAFYHTNCPQCGKAAVRETDTFDTFVQSSWYYARYCSYNQDQAMLDDRARYWTPVDQYTGGIEHAVMHLLYARFFHKVLRDQGLLNSDEPFTRLLTQGMVLKDGAKMSKSKGNTVDPQTLVEQYGADTVRLFSMFAAPPELSLEWSDSGVDGAHRFLKRIWHFAYQHHGWLTKLNYQQIKGQSEQVEWSNANPDLQSYRRQIHELLKQVRFDYERQQFNTVVSGAMKLFNTLNEVGTHIGNDTRDLPERLIQEGLSILLRLLSPITPHLCHALWCDLQFGDNILDAPWPKVISEALRTDQLQIVVQVNGKLRARISIATDADDKTVQEIALTNENVKRFIEKKIKKVIVVPKKLVNIVTE